MPLSTLPLFHVCRWCLRQLVRHCLALALALVATTKLIMPAAGCAAAACICGRRKVLPNNTAPGNTAKNNRLREVPMCARAKQHLRCVANTAAPDPSGAAEPLANEVLWFGLLCSGNGEARSPLRDWRGRRQFVARRAVLATAAGGAPRACPWRTRAGAPSSPMAACGASPLLG
jgi:hypothetical protein